ncbi:diguanylate cyclase domain-containing protein [Modestobacter marinus]|uniref:Diguanylate cyclase (GGDEF)-like protein/PAS domain S-box-containing protein n=1 Tax=Modestobacter marinus TaxID=477641 RepID=A0A846LWV2_9ACTN|nr:diguanylate cyclase [Modestobacter marinus]NIH70225.1 diguanylate cyclase (GGDEF)-like protein/PAS domain S-box-containing protein [Modestobacter marinus]
MSDTQSATYGGIDEILATGAVRSVFQPIIDLDSRQVVAYEALARGPEDGPLARPDLMFAAARAGGRLAELDTACRSAAFRGAVEQGLLAPLTVFVNVEPEVLDCAPLDDLLVIAADAPSELRVVMEITERALAARPAELLRTVERVRELGWGVALDDVGADSMSLAFMSLLRPDVVKLDLRLVQNGPGPAIAEVMNAVNAYAERSGARVLAEGIETEAHLRNAKALGATLGQGWLFGRPAPGQVAAYPVGALALPLPTEVLGDASASPFAALPEGTPLRRSPKALLIELSKQLEREGMRLGETAVIAATFQEARHFTPATAARYRDLVARTGFVCALGEDLPVEPVPGVRGATLAPSDPVRGEWDLVILAPHFSAALLARDLGDSGPDLERAFEFALTYERETVTRAACALLSRVIPRIEGAAPRTSAAASSPITSPVPSTSPTRTTAEDLLHRALSATTSGVTIADMRQPDYPLIFVNAAFEQLSGYRLEDVLGRNCRFLQTPDTDLAAVARIRDAIARGVEARETLLNVRGPERTPWWNEIYLAPVTDESGIVVQYIGVQNDVTARVEAERALVEERDRTRSYLARIEQLAFTDPLTGLPNRRRLEEQVEAMLLDTRLAETALALLFVDLNGFKVVNDRLGHAAGDDVLVAMAGRLRQRLRRGDLLARLGGDEFLVVLPGLDLATAADEAAHVADELAAAVAEPVVLGEHRASVGASVGVSTSPADGDDFADLLHAADERMYAAKGASVRWGGLGDR